METSEPSPTELVQLMHVKFQSLKQQGVHKRDDFFSEFIKMLIYLEPDFWAAEPNYLIWESQSLEMCWSA